MTVRPSFKFFMSIAGLSSLLITSISTIKLKNTLIVANRLLIVILFSRSSRCLYRIYSLICFSVTSVTSSTFNSSIVKVFQSFIRQLHNVIYSSDNPCMCCSKLNSFNASTIFNAKNAPFTTTVLFTIDSKRDD